MRLYHHPRIEKYANDEQQAWTALIGGAIMAVIACVIIVGAVLSSAATGG